MFVHDNLRTHCLSKTALYHRHKMAAPNSSNGIDRKSLDCGHKKHLESHCLIQQPHSTGHVRRGCLCHRCCSTKYSHHRGLPNAYDSSMPRCHHILLHHLRILKTDHTQIRKLPQRYTSPSQEAFGLIYTVKSLTASW